MNKNLNSISVIKPDELSSACVFSLPHSGREYSTDFINSSKLDYITLRSSEDFFLDNFFNLATSNGSSLIKANFPRAFLDLNREPYELDPDMFNQVLPNFVNSTSKKVALGLGTIPRVVSNGTEIYKNKMSWFEAENRIEKFYFPFHMNLKQLLIKNKFKFGFSILIDCHSMPSITQGIFNSRQQILPDFVLGDNFGKSANPNIIHFIEQFLNNKGYSVLRNKPYSGGFITQNYGRPINKIHAIQIEINRSLYMNEVTMELNDSFIILKEALSNLTRSLCSINNLDFFKNEGSQLAAE
tara:strand:- start:331 stop:1224 length:894 start_codon:yes stop_codon:yes gene_type:complete